MATQTERNGKTSGQNVPKPTLLFVHGAMHTPQFFEKIIPTLQANGFRWIAPQMMTCGLPEPLRTIKPDIQMFSAIIDGETKLGNNVVVVTHSFGGVIGGGSTEGFTVKNPSRLAPSATGRVIGIVHVTALMIPTGGAFMDIFNLGVPLDLSNKTSPEGWELMTADPYEILYHDLPREEAEVAVSRLVKMSAVMDAKGKDIYSGWDDVPLWYLVCEDDRVLNVRFQDRLIEHARELGADITVRRVFSSHSPYLSRPAEVLEFIQDAVKDFQGRL